FIFFFFFFFLFFFFFFFLFIFLFTFFFFFSSRRRHTRFSRDWSSDVCSSDLAGAPGGALDQEHLGPVRVPGDHDLAGADPAGPADRSEERRVGKECRSRWS